jgi:hypothetical protein
VGPLLPKVGGRGLKNIKFNQNLMSKPCFE